MQTTRYHNFRLATDLKFMTTMLCRGSFVRALVRTNVTDMAHQPYKEAFCPVNIR